MVMHVQVQAEQSFVSMDDSINVVLIDQDDDCDSYPHNSSSLCRDASNCCHDAASSSRMSNSQVAISYHTHTSILDLTKDEDDDDSVDENDTSVLFRDLLESEPTRLLNDVTNEAAEGDPVNNNVASSTSPFGRFSPEHFFDSLCTAEETLESVDKLAAPVPLSSKRTRTCPPSWSPNCMNAPCISGPSRIEEEEDEIQPPESLPTTTTTIPRNNSSTVTTTARIQVESDVWNLLGCTSPPNSSELDTIWTFTTTHFNAATGAGTATSPDSSLRRRSRASLKDRMDRIHRLRVQNRWAGATRHGVTLSKHGTYSPSISMRATSMDILDAKDYSGWSNSSYDMSFASVMGLSQLDATIWSGNRSRRQSQPKDMTPKADGYDSDPELGSGYDEDEVQFGPEDEWGASDVGVSSTKLPFPNSETPAPSQNEMDNADADDQDFMIYQSVQVSMKRQRCGVMILPTLHNLTHTKNRILSFFISKHSTPHGP